MKPDNEDSLRQALSTYADTTTTSPDAWQDIVDRAEQRASRRRLGFPIGALAATMALIAAGVVVVIRLDEKPVNAQLLSAIEGTQNRDRFAFSVKKDMSPPGTPEPLVEGQYDTRRGVGWARAHPFPPAYASSPEPPGATAGADAVFDRQHFYLRSDLVSSATEIPLATPWAHFDRADEYHNHVNGIVGFSGRPQLLAAVAGVTNPDQTRWYKELPRRSTLVAEGSEELHGVATTRYRVRDGGGRTTYRVWLDTEGLLRRVSAHTPPGAIDPAEPGTQIDYTETWEFYDFGAPLEQDVPAASETTGAATLDLPEDFEAYGPLPKPSSGPRTEDPSFFSLRPVVRLVDLPCTSADNGTSAVLREVSTDIPGEGCVEVGAVAFDAGAVTAAQPVSGPDPAGDWAVEYTLTPEGEAGYNAMARALGMGGQVAVVIDGVVVSTLALESTEFRVPGLKVRGHFTGHFNEQMARQLADRLNAAGPPR